MFKNDGLEFLREYVRTVREPENLFAGRRLAPGFALPDNILIFYHDFTAPAPNAHGRHTLVFPLEEMVYFVERRKIELAPGMMLYVPPYALRFLHPRSPGYGRFFITFEASPGQKYLPGPGGFALTDARWHELRFFLECYASQSPEEASAALMQMLTGLRGQCSEASGSASELPENLLRAIEWIETAPGDVPDIAALARRAGLSPSHLRAQFRRYMGLSLGKFIARKKLDYARFALTNTDLPVAEIAENAGFANIYGFSTFFKRNTKTPPLRFRKQAQKRSRPVPDAPPDGM